ncbi:MAG TPA: L,D-transpeptidase family protein [Candidatus Saccharimonadales bacterium]|nr:L,D-transpeptidase family protein [Candidatus Saccharimonadales bacterium]
MKYKIFIIFLLFLTVGFCLRLQSVYAADTNDFDGDGYADDLEIENGWSPFNAQPVKITDSDVDADGLNDSLEIQFHTNPLLVDTDFDGYSDFEEIDHAFDPLSTSTKKLAQKVEISLKKQILTYYVSGITWKEFSVSTGKPSMPTPKGTFTVVSKIKKAWSKTYSLWMPFWLGLDRGGIGIHELPIWPSGYREGENHLGTPVSHGCIRLGIGSAQYLFDRVDIGFQIFIAD